MQREQTSILDMTIEHQFFQSMALFSIFMDKLNVGLRK